MNFPYTETVTVLRAGEQSGTDRDGEPIYGPGTEAEVPGCLIAPRASEEAARPNGAALIVGYTVYMPTGTDVRSIDRLRFRGAEHSIEGIPGDWRFGPASGIEVATGRAEG